MVFQSSQKAKNLICIQKQHSFCMQPVVVSAVFVMADHPDLIISLKQFPFLSHFFIDTMSFLSLMHDWCLKNGAESQSSREGETEKAISPVLHICCSLMSVQLQSRYTVHRTHTQIYSPPHTHTQIYSPPRAHTHARVCGENQT